jgi:hypothetical protein
MRYAGWAISFVIAVALNTACAEKPRDDRKVVLRFRRLPCSQPRHSWLKTWDSSQQKVSTSQFVSSSASAR